MSTSSSEPNFFILEVRDHLTRFYNLPPQLPARSQDEVDAILQNGYDLTRGLEAMRWVVQNRPEFEFASAYRKFLIKWPLILETADVLRKQQYESAEMRLDTLITIDPDDPSGYYHLGLVYRYLCRFMDSEQALRRCLELYPELAIGHRALGFTLAYLDKKHEAIRELEIAQQDLPDDPDILRALREIRAN